MLSTKRHPCCSTTAPTRTCPTRALRRCTRSPGCASRASTGDAGVGELPTSAPRPTGKVGSLELAQKLLDHGANPNVRVDWQEMKFDTVGGVTRNPPGLTLGRHLLTYNGATAFYVAAKNGDAEYMRLLAANGSDPSITNRFGVTPLMMAAGLDTWEGETPGPFTGVSEAERLAAVKLAVELGNDVNAAADFGDYTMIGDPQYTLLYYPHNIEELLELGTGDPRWSGSTALHGAIISNQPSIVQYLVDAGARLDAKTDTGWTPLMMSRGVFLTNTGREFPAGRSDSGQRTRGARRRGEVSMRRITEAGSLMVVLGFTSIPSSAHHSFGAEYDVNQPITLTGVLTKVEWTNPHSHLYLDVRDDKGNVVNWQFEGYPPPALLGSAGSGT